MTASPEMLPSPVPDLAGVPFGDPVEVTDEDYMRIMRRIGLDDGEPQVSAFNSSI